MTNPITVTLSSENLAALENLDKQERVDDVVNRALCDYLFVRRFHALRSRMTKGVEKLGIYLDKDVFNLDP